MWGEPSILKQLEDAKKQVEGSRAWSEVLEVEDARMKKEVEDWKELFYLLKKDHELLENFQTEEWIIKAKKMGIEL